MSVTIIKGQNAVGKTNWLREHIGIQKKYWGDPNQKYGYKWQFPNKSLSITHNNRIIHFIGTGLSKAKTHQKAIRDYNRKIAQLRKDLNNPKALTYYYNKKFILRSIKKMQEVMIRKQPFKVIERNRLYTVWIEGCYGKNDLIDRVVLLRDFNVKKLVITDCNAIPIKDIVKILSLINADSVYIERVSNDPDLTFEQL